LDDPRAQPGEKTNTNLIIEADFDNLVEAYFDEICEALSKRVRIILVGISLSNKRRCSKLYYQHSNQ
jgi:nucleoid DNA-binding protein